ncbi:hypothetical protein PMW_27 [Pseudomonas phage phiPMW]|uniref:Uncharacterized protein n=1 Tax=Pseudomonas phage phiPMW TaxID=1815582 RepID=A0A1S5R165_9CAUD|nr:hypothetical protein FDG97_gp027 [Pseudomonas phage phiPMW]ANA49152.1 hypothetical protein PMW_27 [Pseudomonas phage phiPMW]
MVVVIGSATKVNSVNGHVRQFDIVKVKRSTSYGWEVEDAHGKHHILFDSFDDVVVLFMGEEK